MIPPKPRAAHNCTVVWSCRLTDTALDKRHNAGTIEGLETWREFTVEWEANLTSRSVWLLLQTLSFQFDGADLSSFERFVRDYEVQSWKAVDDGLKMGVVTLGMHDSRVKEGLIRNTARLDSWNRETRSWKSRTRNSTSTHGQHQYNWEPRPMVRARGRRKERKKHRHRHRHFKPKRDDYPKHKQRS